MNHIRIGLVKQAPFIFEKASKNQVEKLNSQVVVGGLDAWITEIRKGDFILVQKRVAGPFTFVYSHFSLGKTSDLFYFENNKQSVRLSFVLEGRFQHRPNERRSWQQHAKLSHSLTVHPRPYREMRFSTLSVKLLDIYIDPTFIVKYSAKLYKFNVIQKALCTNNHPFVYLNRTRTSPAVLMQLVQLFLVGTMNPAIFEQKIEDLIIASFENPIIESRLSLQFEELFTIHKIKAFIEQHHTEKRLVRMISDKFKIDRKKVNKYFEYYYKQSIISYKNSYKLKKVIQRIQEMTTISRVGLSDLLGFEDLDYSYEYFKKGIEQLERDDLNNLLKKITP